MNKILDKIAKPGYSSLTSEKKETIAYPPSMVKSNLLSVDRKILDVMSYLALLLLHL